MIDSVVNPFTGETLYFNVDTEELVNTEPTPVK